MMAQAVRLPLNDGSGSVNHKDGEDIEGFEDDEGIKCVFGINSRGALRSLA